MNEIALLLMLTALSDPYASVDTSKTTRSESIHTLFEFDRADHASEVDLAIHYDADPKRSRSWIRPVALSVDDSSESTSEPAVPLRWIGSNSDSTSPDEVFEEVPEWQVMPAGLMYKAYLAGEKESRMKAVWMGSAGRRGAIWETALGGHVGVLRYGNRDIVNPEGWQLDLEGAALPRVDLANESDLEACDYRAGWMSTWRRGPNAYKLSYYHISSHAGDEYQLRYPNFKRINYVRDSFVLGWTRNLTTDLQIYGEVGYAWNANGGAKPIELQYGIQYSPMEFGLRGAPFAAINGHTREDFGFITSVNVEAGWQWRGYSNHTYRLGFQYYNGPALQWEFAGQTEQLAGGGMWMDF